MKLISLNVMNNYFFRPFKPFFNVFVLVSNFDPVVPFPVICCWRCCLFCTLPHHLLSYSFEFANYLEVRHRTTIIWNVTTPKPHSAPSSTSTTPTSKSLKKSHNMSNPASTTRLPLPRPTRKSTGAPLTARLMRVDSAKPRHASSEFPEGAASHLSPVQEEVDSAQDDESPRFNRNFSFLELTPSTPTTTSPTTKTPPKVQRLAKPAEVGIRM